MRFSELDNHTIAVWGVGRETRSFAHHLQSRLPGARLVAVIGDDRAHDEPAASEDPVLGGVRFIDGDRALEQLGDVQVIVRSPGVSIHKLQLQALAEDGVTITTPTGLWLHERAGRNVLAVTGTKGKGTTAVLIHHLSSQLRRTHIAGNIGRPVLDLLDAPDDEWVILELSSFQISDLVQGPQIAVLTNLFKEHTDWHGSESVYRREKLRLMALPGMRACAYRPGDVEIEAAIATDVRRVPFGTPDTWHVGADGVRDGAGEPIPLEALPLRGRHNAENLCAALAALDAAELPCPSLPAALAGVKGLPHRLETVLESGGVEWVDDSIATNPTSCALALAAFAGHHIVLIAGGYDRGQDFGDLARVVAAMDVVLVALPVTGARLARDAADAGLAEDRIFEASDMEAAVSLARARARPGSIVLLSPAAASFTAYRDFEQRGEHFAALAGNGS
ncbi:MAG: UDP-N-acetylmuramoyl-L-alanine--D-glutamate ligase [Solirubrobacteraceae bacterium]